MSPAITVLPSICVVIPTLDRPDDLRRALGSILAQKFMPTQILIVDQSDDDRTKLLSEELAPAFAERGSTLEYHHSTERSASRARNFGIRHVRTDIVSFLDDDSELTPAYYRRIAGYFFKNPSWGGIGGSLIRQSMYEGWKGFLRRAISRIFLLSAFDGKMTPSGFGYPVFDRPIRRPMRVEMLHGCNMNFRMRFMRDERFDDWFVGYSFREDAEFTYRISKKTSLWMVPDAHLYHWESASGRLDIERLKKMETRNYHYVFKKHKEKGLLSRILFFYSLAGIVVMDLLELASRRDMTRARRLRAGFFEFFALLTSRP